jgi:cation transport ATPase
MKVTYRVEGMHCGSCSDKVSQALRGLPDVRNATVSLERSTAALEQERDIPLDELNDAVGRVGDYRLQVANGAMPDVAPEAEAGRESLYPLFLIVAYIAGTVVFIAMAAGHWSPETMMRHFMAGFFLVFSFFKLLDLPGFVSAYRGYDLLARRSLAWAWAYPFVELSLGVAYLLALAPIATNSVVLVLMLIGAAGVLRALLDKRAIRCACLGTALNLPMTKVTLIEDLTMAAMAVAMLGLHLT